MPPCASRPPFWKRRRCASIKPADVREEGGRIVIEPLHPARYDVATLVAGITDENRRGSVDMGKPAGHEAW